MKRMLQTLTHVSRMEFRIIIKYTSPVVGLYFSFLLSKL